MPCHLHKFEDVKLSLLCGSAFSLNDMRSDASESDGEE